MRMDAPNRNQCSLIEVPQVGWLFDDSLENDDLDENISDGTVIENCDYMITSCIDDCKEDCE